MVLAPALDIWFNGFDFDQAGGVFVPPDPIGAAGPAHVMNVGNTLAQWFTKAGAQQYTDTLRNFFAPLTPANDTFDPKVVYDQFADRFVVMTLELQDVSLGDPVDSSRILLAVSDDSNPNGTWHFQAIPATTLIAGVPHWADYPGLAVDEEAIYITANMFGFGAAGAFGGTRLWIVPKGAGSGGLYDGGTSNVTVHDPAMAVGLNSLSVENFTFQPAHILGSPPPGATGTWLVSYNGANLGASPNDPEVVQLIRVDDPLGSPTFTGQRITVGDIDDPVLTPVLPDAPQPGTTTPVEVNDRRVLNAVWRNNQLAFTAEVVPTSGPDVGQVTAHWWLVNTVDPLNPTLIDQGDVGAEDLGIGTYTYMPAVALDKAGNLGIGFSASGPAVQPGAFYTVKPAGGSLQSTGVLAQGEDYYVRTFGGPDNRWGDYSGLAIDPADDATFWVYNEYAKSRGTPDALGEDGRYGTRWGSFRLTAVTPPPPAPTPVATVSGRVFHDQHDLGQMDADEPGLAGVYVYIDTDGDGMPGFGEPATTTDQYGMFAIGVPGPGDYTVRQVTPTGFTQTLPANSGSVTATVDANTLVAPAVYFGNSGALLDYGDAPGPYPTTAAQDGARYGVLQGYGLGPAADPANVVDSEVDGLPAADAAGDDADNLADENGVQFVTPLFAGVPATVEVSVSLGGQPRGFLQGFFDFNQDGDWDDPGEWAIRDVRLGAGVHQVTFGVPAGAATGDTYARFRFGRERGIGPTGRGLVGEVEDYKVTVRGNFPVATDDLFDVNQGDSDAPLDVLANDLASASPPITIVAVGPTDQGGVVTIAPDGLSLIYTPNPAFASPPLETFTYTIEDANGAQSTATVSVNVIPTYTAPVAIDDAIGFDPDQPLPGDGAVTQLNVSDLLANDIVGSQGPLTGIALGGAAFNDGRLTLNDPGTPNDPTDDTIDYTAPAGNAVFDSFTYTITDSASQSSTANVSVRLQPPAPPNPAVTVRLDAVDQTGTPITGPLTVGDTFYLAAFVQDLGLTQVNGEQRNPANLMGVFSAYYDVLYNAGLVAINPAENIEFPTTILGAKTIVYDQLTSSDATTPGIVDELGSTINIDLNQPLIDQAPGTVEVVQLQIPFRAVAPGVATFVADPAEGANLDITLFGFSQVIDPGLVNFVGEALTIQAAGAPEPPAEITYTNPFLAPDVNADGVVSPLDALVLVNHLQAVGAGPVGGGAAAPQAAGAAAEGEAAARTHYYLDPSGDGYVSPIDLLLVINYLVGSFETTSGVAPAAPAAEGEAASDASLPLAADAAVSPEAPGVAGPLTAVVAEPLVAAAAAPQTAAEPQTLEAPGATPVQAAPAADLVDRPAIEAARPADLAIHELLSGQAADQTADDGWDGLLESLASDSGWAAEEAADAALAELAQAR